MVLLVSCRLYQCSRGPTRPPGPAIPFLQPDLPRSGSQYWQTFVKLAYNLQSHHLKVSGVIVDCIPRMSVHGLSFSLPQAMAASTRKTGMHFPNILEHSNENQSVRKRWMNKRPDSCCSNLLDSQVVKCAIKIDFYIELNSRFCFGFLKNNHAP